MKTKSVLVFFLVLLAAFQVSAQCRIINDKYASVYISLERRGTFREGDETRSGFVLRLTNNSNCAITLNTQDSVLHREPSVRDIPYSYGKWDDLKQKPTGDAFAVITIRGGKSTLFGVPREYFDYPDAWIKVRFGYKWEDDRLKDGSFVSTIHTVNFAYSWLPENARAPIR